MGPPACVLRWEHERAASLPHRWPVSAALSPGAFRRGARGEALSKPR